MYNIYNLLILYVFFVTDLIRIKNEICDAEFNVRSCSIVMVVNSVEEGLLNCDLLIVIGSMKRQVLIAHASRRSKANVSLKIIMPLIRIKMKLDSKIKKPKICNFYY
jgi:hypothetical protein